MLKHKIYGQGSHQSLQVLQPETMYIYSDMSQAFFAASHMHPHQQPCHVYNLTFQIKFLQLMHLDTRNCVCTS